LKILVTGGAGFIGSAVVRELILRTQHEVLNVDCLTYAGNLDSLAEVQGSNRYSFTQVNICDFSAILALLEVHRPTAVMHLAAESHVDRSIDGPRPFLDTNVNGTYFLLEAARAYHAKLAPEAKAAFRFHHVSTDEVFGSLGPNDPAFTESSPYQPSSPYSATKAASDHFVRAWHCTFGLPIVITNCSNNYGPFHFPEKLVPHMILNALHGKPLPVYGDGAQVRDWLYVEDHARALIAVIERGRVGETYNIGGRNERKNIDIVRLICSYLEDLAGNRKPAGVHAYEDLIKFVADRPGHDRRYAIDASKMERELFWKPQETVETGLRKTVAWYLENESWWSRVLNGAYRLERLGLENGDTKKD